MTSVRISSVCRGGSIRASRKLAAILAILMLPMAASPAFPTENGSQMYPVGTNTVFPGIAPSPGQTWWQNYNLYYSADTFGDNKGNSLVPGFQLDVAAYAPRFFHSWRAQIGPYGLASAFVVPIVYSSVGTDFGNNTDFNIGDVTLQPLYLTYANKEKTLFAYGGVDFNLPTFTALSRRYVTANPIVTLTWFPAKSVDVNMIALVELALSENASTGYRSGNLVVLEYSAHARPFAFLPKLSLGVNGYYVDQFTSDEADGVDIGFEGRSFAIGPELVYQIGESAGFAIKWQHEFDVKNRPEGEKFWFQFQKPLGSK
jgi:hypothetical protein